MKITKIGDLVEFPEYDVKTNTYINIRASSWLTIKPNESRDVPTSLRIYKGINEIILVRSIISRDWQQVDCTMDLQVHIVNDDFYNIYIYPGKPIATLSVVVCPTEAKVNAETSQKS